MRSETQLLVSARVPISRDCTAIRLVSVCVSVRGYVSFLPRRIPSRFTLREGKGESERERQREKEEDRASPKPEVRVKRDGHVMKIIKSANKLTTLGHVINCYA